MIRLLIVESQTLMGTMMATALQNHADMQVVDYVGTVAEALAASAQVDVVLAGAELPDGGALEIARALRGTGCKAIITGLVDSPALILSYLEAGASGYILRDSTGDQFLRIIRAVAAGEACIPPAIVTLLVDRMRELNAMTKRLDREALEFTPNPCSLTDRERDVLSLLAEGATNQDIASALVIELGTVKNHVHSILKKLNASSRVEAARYYLTVLAPSGRPLHARVEANTLAARN